MKALAGELGLSIYVVTLSSPNLNDDTLRELLASARNRGVLLLEDVDVALRKPGGAPAPRAPEADDTSADGDDCAREGGASLSFSGLLNALDGVAAQEGKLLFVTTNHIERLDAALIRPGRVDVRCQFSLCSRAQARALFLHFYSSLAHDGAHGSASDEDANRLDGACKPDVNGAAATGVSSDAAGSEAGGASDAGNVDGNGAMRASQDTSPPAAISGVTDGSARVLQTETATPQAPALPQVRLLKDCATVRERCCAAHCVHHLTHEAPHASSCYCVSLSPDGWHSCTAASR